MTGSDPTLLRSSPRVSRSPAHLAGAGGPPLSAANSRVPQRVERDRSRCQDDGSMTFRTRSGPHGGANAGVVSTPTTSLSRRSCAVVPLGAAEKREYGRQRRRHVLLHARRRSSPGVPAQPEWPVDLDCTVPRGERSFDIDTRHLDGDDRFEVLLTYVSVTPGTHLRAASRGGPAARRARVEAGTALDPRYSTRTSLARFTRCHRRRSRR